MLFYSFKIRSGPIKFDSYKKKIQSYNYLKKIWIIIIFSLLILILYNFLFLKEKKRKKINGGTPAWHR